MRALLVTIVSIMAAGVSHAQSVRVAGAAGYLSEWAFSGNLPEIGTRGGNQFSGAVTWKHVGLCSHNGPEEKSGEMTLQISRSGPVPEIHAVVEVDGARCEYNGPLSDSSTGRMDCPKATGIPLRISVDVR